MNTKRILIAGLGYVGLTTGVCLAELGHSVVAYDVDDEKIVQLRKHSLHFREPELMDLMERNAGAGRLEFTSSCEESMRDVDIAFICSGTQPDSNGAADLSDVEATVQRIALGATKPFTLVLQSNVSPRGSFERLSVLLSQYLPETISAAVVVNPTFMREGSAVFDFFHSDRIVIGAWDYAAAEDIATLYSPLHCPVVLTDPISAQLTRYVSNAFLTMKTCFINEVARIATQVGADIGSVTEAMGLDTRLGTDFSEDNKTFNTSCYSGDVLVLAALAEDNGGQAALLRAVIENESGRHLLIRTLHDALHGITGKKVCVLGLVTHGRANEAPSSPVHEVVTTLCRQGAHVHAYDPDGDRINLPVTQWPGIRYFADAYQAANGSDAILVASDWPELGGLDWGNIRVHMTGNTVIDGRGMLSPDTMRELGFDYLALAS